MKKLPTAVILITEQFREDTLVLARDIERNIKCYDLLSLD